MSSVTGSSVTAMGERSRLAVGSLLAAGLLWGLTWMPFKYFGAQGLNGITFTMVSYGLIGLAVLPWLLYRTAAWLPQRGLVTLIALAGGGANVCFVTALMSGEVMRVMLLFYLAPVWGVLGGAIFLGERVTRLRAGAAAAALAGAFLILGGPEALGAAPGLVDVLALASGALYASQNIATRAARRVPLDVKALIVFVGCGLLAGSLVLLTGQDFPPLDAALIGQLGAFSGVWTMAAMAFTVYGVTHLEAGRAAVLLVFELVAAMVSAMLIAGENLSRIEWVGAALITVAALVEARSNSNEEGKNA
jgi:drug/metabolite transporter (DMT)-like permease